MQKLQDKIKLKTSGSLISGSCNFIFCLTLFSTIFKFLKKRGGLKMQVRLLLLCLMILSINSYSQWYCVYATYDNADSNGTGNRTASVGVISEDLFIACVTRPGINTSFLLPYVNADSAVGRLYSYGYGTSKLTDFQMGWVNPGDPFDSVAMSSAWFIHATPDSLIYVANNDPDHNILVFKFTGDTIMGTKWRIVTGANPIFALDLDASGRIYVINDTTIGEVEDVKIYGSIRDNPDLWETHAGDPLYTIDLPDGIYKGIEVNDSGTWIFISVSDTVNRKVIRYKGSIESGYQLDESFIFQLTDADTGIGPVKAIPIGLEYLDENNLLFVACSVWDPPSLSDSYVYGRIYVLNGNTGEPIDTIDVARWNFEHLDSSYTGRSGGKIPGNASGYTSTYDVKFDEKKNLYSQSYYGWTVEKWAFRGELPVIPPVKVERRNGSIPNKYELKQNYPNPFNPSTIIEFSIPSKQHVSLKIYTILGQEVATLVDEILDAGIYKVEFDASGLPSGSYIYTLKAGRFIESRKLIFIK
jgi:hypothetical protein